MLPDRITRVIGNILGGVGAVSDRTSTIRQNIVGGPVTPVKQVPFGALGMTDIGEPYYGPGPKGYIRKIYANIFNPNFFLSNPTDDQLNSAELTAKAAENLWKNRSFFQWAEKTLGLKTSDLAKSWGALYASVALPGKTEEELNAASERQHAQTQNLLNAQIEASGESRGTVPNRIAGLELGANYLDLQAEKAQNRAGEMFGPGVAAAVGLERRWIGQAFYSALDLLGAADWAVRKGLAPTLAVQDMKRGAQHISSPPTIAETLFKPGSAFGSTYAYINAAFLYLNPDTRDEFVDRVKAYEAGSPMIYTMVFDGAKRNEFIRRYEQGEDVSLLKLELENPWIELAGSILLDPTTYTGLALPTKLGKAEKAAKVSQALEDARKAGGFRRILKTMYAGRLWLTPARFAGPSRQILPTVGDLISTFTGGRLRFGKQRLVYEAEHFFDAPAGLENAFKNAEATVDGSRALDEIFEAAEKIIKNPDYGIATKDAAGRASQLSRTVGTVTGLVAGQSQDLDETLSLWQAMGKMFSPDPEVRKWAYGKLFKSSDRFGGMFFSDAGRSAAYVMNKLTDPVNELSDMRDAYRFVQKNKGFLEITEDQARLAKKYADKFVKADGGEIAAVAEWLNERIGKAAAEIYPSVDEMKKAAKAVKGGSTAARDVELAQKYKAIPRHVKVTNETLGRLRKAQQWTKAKFFNGAYLKWNASYPTRDRLAMAPILAAELGFSEALKITGRVEVAQFSPKLAGVVSDMNIGHVSQRLGGIVPESMYRGIASAAPDVKLKKGVGKAIDINMLSVDARGDMLTGQEIVRRVVDHVMDTFYENGLPPVAELQKVFTDGEVGIIIDSIRQHDGDIRAVKKTVEKIFGAKSVETWRFVPPTKKLQQQLQDAHLWDAFQDARMNSATRDEFLEKWDAMIRAFNNDADRVLQETPRLGENLPDGVAGAFFDADEFMQPEEASLATKTVQKFQEARDTVDEALDQITGIVHGRLKDEAARIELARQITAHKKMLSSSVDRINELNRLVNEKWIPAANRGEDLTKLWNNAVVNDVVERLPDGSEQQRILFSMRDLFPQINPATLSKREFIDMLYKARASVVSERWALYNNQVAEGLLGEGGVIRNYVDAAGLEWDSIIRSISPDQQNWAKNAAEKLAQANILNDAWLSQRTLGEANNATLARAIAIQNGFATQLPSGANNDKALLSLINNHLPEGLPKFPNLDTVPPEVTTYAFRMRSGADVTDIAETAKRAGSEIQDVVQQIDSTKNIPPAYIPGTAPTYPRQLYEARPKFLEELDAYKNEILSRWGHEDIIESALDTNSENVLANYLSDADKRIKVAQRYATVYSNKTRDWVLHDYDKTYADLASEFLFMYPYWPSRTYLKMFERTLSDPRLAVSYMKYRHFMDQKNQGMPEWWKYNIPIHIPGMPEDHPLFFNLEATVNPLNGLTGVDFDDPRKRVDWISSVIDDVGKFGPTLYTPIQWINGIRLMQQGEMDAGQRWVNRAIPQTQTIKAGLTLAGADINFGPLVKHNEFDPAVNFFMNGMDPYERNRVGRAAATIMAQNPNEEAAILDQFYQESGPLYDAARVMAINERAPGQLASYFVGVGFKPRTEGDMLVDKFYDEYAVLLGNRNIMSPENYRMAWTDLRARYPFMDTVLLAKRSGDDRDTAYAYAVLGRIMPGQMTDLLKTAGINDEMINQFYESKGDWSRFTPQDKDRFLAGLTDVSSLLKIPDGATRQEWDAARIAYQNMQDEVSRNFGSSIYEEISYWFDLPDDQKDQYLENHPSITRALQLQDRIIAYDPLLYAYYGSINTLDRYYTERMYDKLRNKYGYDIQSKWDHYYELQLVDQKKANAYKRAHPELSAYSQEKAKLLIEVNQSIVRRSKLLPDHPEIGIRADFKPQSQYQQELLASIQPERVRTVAEWRAEVGDAMWTLVYDYWKNGEDLPYVAEQQLDYIAPQLGYNTGQDLLAAMGMSIP